jgi:hypothetical protein
MRGVDELITQILLVSIFMTLYNTNTMIRWNEIV